MVDGRLIFYQRTAKRNENENLGVVLGLGAECEKNGLNRCEIRGFGSQKPYIEPFPAGLGRPSTALFGRDWIADGFFEANRARNCAKWGL